MFSCNLCSFTFLFTSSLRVFLLDIPVRLVMGFEVFLLSLHVPHNLTSHFTQSHFPVHTISLPTSHNLTSYSTLCTISLPTPHFWSHLSFLLQATGTFMFPDLFPNQDVKEEESAQKQADATPEEPEPLRWFWRQQALQEPTYEVSYQSLASPEWHWSEENGTVIVLHPSGGPVSALRFRSKEAGLDEHWSVEFGAGHWLRLTETADKKQKGSNFFWTATFSSHVYEDYRGYFIVVKQFT